jgi:hypothetical protein
MLIVISSIKKTLTNLVPEMFGGALEHSDKEEEE